MKKQYGKLDHEKACDYIIIISYPMATDPYGKMIIQFYAGKPFTCENFFGPIDKENIQSSSHLWRILYSNNEMKHRKVSKSLARYYYEEAKATKRVLLKASPDGVILKDYR